MLVGLILAGGRSTRFGREKAVMLWRGKTLIADSMAPLADCGAVAVSAPVSSGAAQWAQSRELAILPDPDGAPDGPLTGLREGLRWARRLQARHLALVPCDTPRLPPDLFKRLEAAMTFPNGAAYAATRDGIHPLTSLWEVPQALAVVERALASDHHPPVREVLAQLDAVKVDFPHPENFLNANRIEDLDA
jgi:molybdopterin-guanine dinucleotide biosynthesis protein A